MLQQRAFRPQTETPVATVNNERAVSAQHSPAQNHLLAALPMEDYLRLLPHLVLVPLPLGWSTQGAGDRGKYLYFLISGIVSRQYVTKDGASTEIAIVGNEGVVGVAAFLSGETLPTDSVVLTPGYAYRLDAALMRKEFARQGALTDVLLRYTMALITQIGQIAMCNRHHEIEQQLCRTLLSSLDRLSSNKVTTTHEVISTKLGVRREGVTMALGNLQKDGLLHCSRGHITVLDRAKLEARVCECYGVVNREYERLLNRESNGPTATFRGH